MTNKDDNEMPLIGKEQLYSERSFVDYCSYDYHNGRKLDNIDEAFLRAATADGFLQPLLQAEDEVQQNDGSKKKTLVNYYSPHQIYIVAALSKNIVYEDFLWGDFKNIEFYKQQGFRMVNWGWSGYAFNISLEQKNKDLRIVNQTQQGEAYSFTIEEGKSKKDPNIDHLKDCYDFQNFLMLLHSFKQPRYSPTGDRVKDRYFSKAPSLYFDLTLLKTEGENILKKHGLDLGKLKRLAHGVAGFANDIDPLQYWYYYINLHPQWRKDLFKGITMLAQELYRIYDLLIEVIELVSKEKQPPLFELLYGNLNFHPFLIPRIEHKNGTDVKSMWAAIKKFKEWMVLENNKDFVEENTLFRLQNFEIELKEYEDKYGARCYISNGIRPVEMEEKLKIDDLDLKTKQYVEQIIQQAQKKDAMNGRKFLSHLDDEFEEKVRKKEMTLEEAIKEDNRLFIKQEIFEAIERRLSSLKRELWEILNSVEKQIAKQTNEAWDIEHNFGNHFWFNRDAEFNKFSRERQLELYNKEYHEALDKAQCWSKKRDDFGEIEYTMSLLFCSVCRQKPVIIHQSHNDEKISNNAICDDCIKNAREPRTIKQAELRCDYCGELLYKYAYKNKLNDLLFNKAPADINVELEYGRLQIRIGCKNCKQINHRWIDWGWTV